MADTFNTETKITVTTERDFVTVTMQRHTKTLQIDVYQSIPTRTIDLNISRRLAEDLHQALTLALYPASSRDANDPQRS